MTMSPSEIPTITTHDVLVLIFTLCQICADGRMSKTSGRVRLWQAHFITCFFALRLLQTPRVSTIGNVGFPTKTKIKITRNKTSKVKFAKCYHSELNEKQNETAKPRTTKIKWLNK